MAHPRSRTWTLAELDRSTAYELWFDPEQNRWECRVAGAQGAPLVTRAGARKAAAAASAAGGAASGPEQVFGGVPEPRSPGTDPHPATGRHRGCV